MEDSYRKALQTEREKLDQMIEDTLKNRIPLSQNESVQKQGQLIDRLIEQAKKK